MPLRREDVIKLAEKYIELADQARELINAVNREKTTVGKHFAKYMEENNLPAGFGFHIGEREIRYSLGKGADVMSAETVIRMFKAGEITEKQLVQIIDVRKGDAERVLGADVVASNLEFRSGKDMDIRITKADDTVDEAQDVIPETAPKIMRIPKQPAPGPRKRLLRIVPRAGIQRLPTRTTETTPLRRLKT